MIGVKDPTKCAKKKTRGLSLISRKKKKAREGVKGSRLVVLSKKLRR